MILKQRLGGVIHGVSLVREFPRKACAEARENDRGFVEGLCSAKTGEMIAREVFRKLVLRLEN